MVVSLGLDDRRLLQLIVAMSATTWNRQGRSIMGYVTGVGAEPRSTIGVAPVPNPTHWSLTTVREPTLSWVKVSMNSELPLYKNLLIWNRGQKPTSGILKRKQTLTICAYTYCCMPEVTIAIYIKCLDITWDSSRTHFDMNTFRFRVYFIETGVFSDICKRNKFVLIGYQTI